jgi:hypothetical protein
MPWQARLRQTLPTVVWVCLVLAIAAYGSVVVRNVTDMLAAIAHPAPAVIAIAQPRR